MRKNSLAALVLMSTAATACALDTAPEPARKAKEAQTTVVHSTEVNVTVSVTVPSGWDQFKADVDNITGPFRQISAALSVVSSITGALNGAVAIAQFFGITPTPPDPFLSLETEINGLATGLTWQIGGQPVYDDVLHFATAFDAIDADANLGIRYDTTDDSYTPTIDALHGLEGVDPNDPTGVISLFSPYGRTFIDAATVGTGVGDWKWAIPAVDGKTRPTVSDGNLVYDWRLGMPALLEAIPLRLLVMSTIDANFRTDLVFHKEIDEARNALLKHYETMAKGVVCGYKTFASSQACIGPICFNESNDSCSVNCADMYTGLEASGGEILYGTCEGYLANSDLYRNSLAEARVDVINHMPFFEMDAAINQLYLLNHPGPDLTEVNPRIALADTAPGTSLCVAAQSSAAGAPAVLATCNGGAAQQWLYDRKAATVRNPTFGTCLAVQTGNRSVTMMPSQTPGQLDVLNGYSYPVLSAACDDTVSQKWTFDPEHQRLSSAVGANVVLTSGAVDAPLSAATTVAFNRNGAIENQWKADTTPIAPVFDVTSHPAVSSRGNGTLDVFDISGGRMFERRYNAGWQDWVPLPPMVSPRFLVGKVAAVSWDDTRNDIFAHDDLGNIVHLWANSDNWSTGWETIATGQPCLHGYPGDECRGLTVSSWGPNHLDVFDVVPNSTGFGRTITQITYDNGWQAPWFPFGDTAPVTQAISAVSWGPGRIDLVGTIDFAEGEHADQYFTNDGVTWFGPFDLGPIGGPFTMPSNIALSTWGVNVLDVLTIGAIADPGSSAIGQLSFRPDTAWQPWATPSLPSGQGPALFAPITSVSSGPNRIDVVFSQAGSAGNTVGHAWYNEVSPVGWFGAEVL